MLLSGTFSFCALTRSMSAKSCGVLARKVVKTFRSDGLAVRGGDQLVGGLLQRLEPAPARGPRPAA